MSSDSDENAEDSAAGSGRTIFQFNDCRIPRLQIPVNHATINIVRPSTAPTADGSRRNNVSYADVCGEPETKRARINHTTENELTSCLNKAIEVENASSFYSENLNKPSQAVWPKLRQVVTSQHAARYRTLSERDSLEEKPGKMKDTSIEMDDIFTDVKRFLLVVGCPGSGKSTFANGYGQKVLKREIDGMKDISIVYFVNARQLSQDAQEVSFLDFFFSRLVHGFNEIGEDALTWLLNEENQKKILLIIDGLNDLNFCMETQYNNVGYTEEAKPEVLFYNLLSKRLLPRAKILATSLPETVQNYHAKVRPDKTIKLTGFTRKNTEYLFRELVGAHVPLSWETFPDTLKLLCSTPLFLTYVAYMYKCDHEERSSMDVVNVSSILLRLIQNFCNRNKWSRESPTFRKLTKFCLELCRQNKVMFNPSDLTSELPRIEKLCSEIPEVMTGVLEPNSCKSKMCFSHISIQETLAALGSLDLSLPEFRKVVRDDMRTARLLTMKQVICGVLINKKDLFEKFATNLSFIDEKRKLLLENMCVYQSPSQRLTPEEMVRHLKCVHEMGKPINEGLLPSVVDISGQDLDNCTAHVFASVLSSCSRLSELSLYHCNLDDSKVEILCDCLDGVNTQIRLLNFGFNTKLGLAAMKRLAKSSCKCKAFELDLHSCDLTSSHMTAFLSEFKKHPEKTLKQLLLRANPELGEKGLMAVAHIVEAGGMQKLDLSRCDVSPVIFKKMAPHLCSLQNFVLTSNFKQGPSEDHDRMAVVGKCVAASRSVDEVHLNWCELDHRDLVNLDQTLLNTEIKGLNISNNSSLSSKDETMEVLCKIVEKCKTDRMDIHNCGFTDMQKQRLREHVREFTRMDTYLSLELETSQFEDTIKQNKGRFLDVSLRNTRVHLQKLPGLLKDYETSFRKLCLPEGKNAEETDIQTLLQLLPFISEELWLREWDIDDAGQKKLKSFSKGRDDRANFEIFFKKENA